jgi:hypothetical protein
MAHHNFRSDRGQDPIAELARLIVKLFLTGRVRQPIVAGARGPPRRAMKNRPGSRLVG